MFDDIFNYFDGKSALARKLGVTKSAVSRWIQNESIPPFRAMQIEKMSGGKFKATEIINRGKLWKI